MRPPCVQTKGWQGLFSGMGARVTQTALMSALFFTVFERTKQVGAQQLLGGGCCALSHCTP